MLMEQRIEYVLTTGGNWALGTIGDFKLTIDKGDPDNVVSFCGENVRKTGPTTFEMTAKDFYPERDIDILILHPFSWTATCRPRALPARAVSRPATSRGRAGEPAAARADEGYPRASCHDTRAESAGGRKHAWTIDHDWRGTHGRAGIRQ